MKGFFISPNVSPKKLTSVSVFDVSYSGGLKKQDVRLNGRNGGMILQHHTTYSNMFPLMARVQNCQHHNL